MSYSTLHPRLIDAVFTYAKHSFPIMSKYEQSIRFTAEETLLHEGEVDEWLITYDLPYKTEFILYTNTLIKTKLKDLRTLLGFGYNAPYDIQKIIDFMGRYRYPIVFHDRSVAHIIAKHFDYRRKVMFVDYIGLMVSNNLCWYNIISDSDEPVVDIHIWNINSISTIIDNYRDLQSITYRCWRGVKKFILACKQRMSKGYRQLQYITIISPDMDYRYGNSDDREADPLNQYMGEFLINQLRGTRIASTINLFNDTYVWNGDSYQYDGSNNIKEMWRYG